TAQLAELDVWFERAIAAERRLSVLVTGAAGSGKSRLVAELIARRLIAGGTGVSPSQPRIRATDETRTPLRVTSTAASPAGRLAPFSLIIDLYQAALGLAPARGRAARAQLVQRLTHLMTEAGASGERARAVALDLDRAMELRDGVGV